MRDWRIAVKNLKAAINYARLGKNPQYLKEFFSSSDLEAVLKSPERKDIKKLFHALRLLSKVDETLFKETLDKMMLMDTARQNNRILYTIEGLLLEYEADMTPRSQSTRLQIADQYEKAAERLQQGGFISLKIVKGLRLKSARLRAIYYAHDPNQLQKSYENWVKAALIAKDLEDKDEYDFAMANQKKLEAEISLFRLAGQGTLDPISCRDVAKLYDEAAMLFKALESRFPDSYRRGTAAEEARICEAFSSLCRFFADWNPIDYGKAAPILEKIQECASGSPRSIWRKGLTLSAKTGLYALVRLGDNLVRLVWDRYRQLEKELNEYHEKIEFGFHGPKPLDFFLGDRGRYRDKASVQVIRIFDDIYSKFKHIQEPIAVIADESTKARAVELAEDIARLDSLLKEFMDKIKRRK
ncbi:MAG: hypothetical protein FGF48_07255 [Candidatus Brockarchaeota archaeon]|nr:hypothetical protein [Candidatus Brockarchaeota archaeon]